MKAFELSQTLKEKWVKADIRAKRRLLEIVCLNFSLDGVSLVPTIRKPFQILLEGLTWKNSRRGCHHVEPLAHGFLDAFLHPLPHIRVAQRLATQVA